MENALSDVQGRLMQELERMDTQLSKVVRGEKTRLFKSMVSNLKHLTEMTRSMNFTNNAEINEIADAIEAHLLTHEVDAYKDNAAMAGASARRAREIHERVSDDGVWMVNATDNGDPGKLSITEVVVQIPEDTNGEAEGGSPGNAQTEDDMNFLSSLANPITKEEHEDETDDVKEPEENKQPIGEPEFDEDDYLFSN